MGQKLNVNKNYLFPKIFPFWSFLEAILALKTKRKNAHGLFIVGSYHISFHLSVAAAYRCLDLIHKQRILSDKLCAESAAEKFQILSMAGFAKISNMLGKSLTGAPLFVI